MDDAKKNAVERYLQAQFPGRDLQHQEDFDLDAQKWKVKLDKGSTLLVKITDVLFEDVPTEELGAFLDQMKVGDALHGLDPANELLLVTSKGPAKLERK